MISLRLDITLDEADWAKTRTLLTGEPVTIPDDLIASLVDAIGAAGYRLPGGTVTVSLLDDPFAPITPDGDPR